MPTMTELRCGSSSADGSQPPEHQDEHRDEERVQQRGEDWDVTVAFKGLGIKTLAASFADLQKAP